MYQLLNISTLKLVCKIFGLLGSDHPSTVSNKYSFIAMITIFSSTAQSA